MNPAVLTYLRLRYGSNDDIVMVYCNFTGDDLGTDLDAMLTEFMEWWSDENG